MARPGRRARDGARRRLLPTIPGVRRAGATTRPPAGRWRGAVRLAAAVAAGLLLAACQVRTVVSVDVAEDGSGTVAVAVGLDPEAMARVPDLAELLRVEDLAEAGWEVTGPERDADGTTWVRATKRFATHADAGRVLAEVAGTGGPFRDFRLDREHAFARTRFRLEGVVDLSGGLEAFGDDALAALLEGEPLGEDEAAIEARLGRPLAEAFTVEVAVRLPGSVEASNADGRDGRALVWTPTLGGGPVELVAGTEVRRTGTVVLVAVAVVAALAALAVVAVGAVRSRGRRKAPSHAAG